MLVEGRLTGPGATTPQCTSSRLQLGAERAAWAPSAPQERATYCNSHWEEEFKKVFTLEFSRRGRQFLPCRVLAAYLPAFQGRAGLRRESRTAARARCAL